MSSWTAASSDCSRPVNNYVHVKTADLYRPNARLTPERQGYQVLTPFGKLGYSPIIDRDRELCTKALRRRHECRIYHLGADAVCFATSGISLVSASRRIVAICSSVNQILSMTLSLLRRRQDTHSE